MKKTILTLFLASFITAVHAVDKIKIGVEAAYPPFSAVNEAGEFVGFDIDIAKALCAQMKADCELVKIDWDGLIPSLLNEKIDAIVASMSDTAERRKIVDFTNKYYSNKGQLVLKKELAQKINNENWKEALKGKVLGVQTSTIHDTYATAELAPIVKSIERYNTQDEANLDLVAGRIDATLADQTALANGFLKTDMGKDYAFAAPLFNNPDYYGSGVSIAIRKGDEALKQRFNDAIKAIRDNGEYQKINQKYFDFDIY
ncbi:transporter substrate-binding domain-containing protein [Suttonella ornithocola]|uniref:Histidine-binding periplasmic protein n=1 Tax=Suttonella ornithocola TaxID=279832 RepID=A0A380MTM6_9GAMM|nr:transporter substrate-binding domain-containing protein [Suttonella ornithocola]SUO95969.1 Histidine-binding periplasmic protein precursor [Suttonella ornithocola]